MLPKVELNTQSCNQAQSFSDPSLKSSGNAWKRTGEHEITLRKVIGILHKLTKESFVASFKQVLDQQ